MIEAWRRETVLFKRQALADLLAALEAKVADLQAKQARARERLRQIDLELREGDQ